jgi:hypothetical protein
MNRPVCVCLSAAAFIFLIPSPSPAIEPPSYELSPKTIVCKSVKYVHQAREYRESGDDVRLQRMLNWGRCWRVKRSIDGIRFVWKLSPKVIGIPKRNGEWFWVEAQHVRLSREWRTA